MSAPAIGGVGLHFRVSADEEWCQLMLRHSAGDIELAPRTHHYLLLTLARPQLQRMLRIPEGQIDLQVFGLRKQLAAAGVANAAAVVERRKRYDLLRIGPGDLSVEQV